MVLYLKVRKDTSGSEPKLDSLWSKKREQPQKAEADVDCLYEELDLYHVLPDSR